jgi:hypothetical protein
MAMTIRSTKIIIRYVAYPIGCLFFGYLGTLYWPLLFLVLAWTLFLTIWCLQLRCPNCKQKIGGQKYKILGFTTFAWRPLVSTRCEHCGHPFDKKVEY